jgi:hypothetical protein
MNKYVQRLKEPSTWAGLAALGVLLGGDPVKADAVQQVGVALAGLLAVFLPESKA